MTFKNPRKTIDHRRKLRRKETSAEKILWQNLRNKKIEKQKFYRQFGVGLFILDFFNAKHKLAIEIDGGYHETDDQQKYDKQRTEFLNKQGIKVIRFTNKEVFEELEYVLHRIKKELPLTPSCYTRGGRMP